MDLKPSKHFEPRDIVLLTGAGFTANFDGFLKKGMWGAIYNQRRIQSEESLRSVLKDNYDYEAVYDRVLFPKPGGPQYSDREKRIFTDAVAEAYSRMHCTVCSDKIDRWSTATAVCRNFLTLLAGAGTDRGFIFTLNQDLFFECFYSNGSAPQIHIPGITPRPKWFNGRLLPYLEPEDIAELPDNDQAEKFKNGYWGKNAGDFHYIKLHGSHGWKLQGKDVLVIGTSKSKLIKDVPLLSFYLDIFKSVVTKAARVVIIGYGFGDGHINEVLVEAVINGARLCVLSVEEPKEFITRLRGVQDPPVKIEGKTYRVGPTLVKGLGPYHTAKVIDLTYPNTQDLTAVGGAVVEDFGLL